MKFHVISAAVWLRYFTDQSLYVHMSNSNESYQFQHKLGESHDLTQQPVITYIYLCGQIYASCSLHFKPSFSNRAKCNTGFRENITLAFYHIQTVGAKSLLVLINAAMVCLCLDNTIIDRAIYNFSTWPCSPEWGTQLENSATWLVFICRSSCNSNVWQSE